jgi:hypothetical protein
VVTWPQLEGRGAVASWLAGELLIESAPELHEQIRSAIYARVPRLRTTLESARVPRGICDGCLCPIGRDKLGWCPLCIAAFVVVKRERATAALPPVPTWRAA